MSDVHRGDHPPSLASFLLSFEPFVEETLLRAAFLLFIEPFVEETLLRAGPISVIVSATPRQRIAGGALFKHES
jgi:hypothetical protein